MLFHHTTALYILRNCRYYNNPPVSNITIRKQKKKSVSHLIKRIHTDKMPSITKIASIVAAVASVASALPAQPRFTEMQDKIFNVMKRQSAAEQALGLTDVDVLQLYV